MIWTYNYYDYDLVFSEIKSDYKSTSFYRDDNIVATSTYSDLNILNSYIENSYKITYSYSFVGKIAVKIESLVTNSIISKFEFNSSNSLVFFEKFYSENESNRFFTKDFNDLELVHFKDKELKRIELDKTLSDDSLKKKVIDSLNFREIIVKSIKNVNEIEINLGGENVFYLLEFKNKPINLDYKSSFENGVLYLEFYDNRYINKPYENLNIELNIVIFES